ncbi:MAG: ABC transporter ATP-binding protein [Chloroflexi bacterium]|nr:ABC transporter ATP-binding protein [Chloroflexota bacterium]
MNNHLVVENVHLTFGGVQALKGISLSVRQGELVPIIGPNGAGKSSLLNAISGLYMPQRGCIEFDRMPLVGRKPHQVAQLGIARTFQNIGLFPELSVLDNLLVGSHLHMRSSLLAGGLYWGPARREEGIQEHAMRLVAEKLGVAAHLQREVGSLPYGMQKRVELGRALAQSPRLLLLDEPMAGMNRQEKQEMARRILDIHRGTTMTIIMIEHDMGVVMDLSQRIFVLDSGKCIAAGTPTEIGRDPAVIRAYLGEQRGEARELSGIA